MSVHLSGRSGSHGSCGIYIHIPFCIRKCPYCDFNSVADLSLIPNFIRAVIREIEMAERPPVAVDSIFLGGGTPSVLETGQVGAILETVSGCFAMAENVEITMEINPGTVNAGTLQSLRAAGINRLNIGTQSFCDSALGFLGRIHTARDGLTAFSAARSAGFENIGLDLMFGLPGQTAAQWRQDLDTAVSLGSDHLSCYQLTFESGTRMTADLEARKFKALSGKTAAELFEQTGRLLAAAGYERYEISNFAKSRSKRCRHNLKYWIFEPYMGFGPSAHSFDGCRRSWNVSDVTDYLDRIASGRPPAEGDEAVDRIGLMTEAIYLGLRLTDGIAISEFENCFEIEFSETFRNVSAALTARGMVVIENGHCRLTPGGIPFADSIAARFIEAI
jgi:oxygen-independent coproporphyrinogen III oxidase